MIRTAFAAVLATLGLASAVAAHPPVAVYYPPVAVRAPACRIYEVQYRHCSRDCWQTYRITTDHRCAHNDARDLRRQGYQARVQH